MIQSTSNKTLLSEFTNLLRRADQLVEQQNHEGLKDLIKLVLRPLQSIHLLDAYVKDDHQSIGELNKQWCFGFKSPIRIKQNDGSFVEKKYEDWLWSEGCFIENDDVYPTLSLGSDITFSAPWEPRRIINNLGKIGKDRPYGEFVQDSNHMVFYIYPLMIGTVGGGNHSIMQGILDGKGEIKPTEMYDVSPLLTSVSFDGASWICSYSGNNIGTPRYPELGWVWEIAKRYVEVQSAQ